MTSASPQPTSSAPLVTAPTQASSLPEPRSFVKTGLPMDPLLFTAYNLLFRQAAAFAIPECGAIYEGRPLAEFSAGTTDAVQLARFLHAHGINDGLTLSLALLHQVPHAAATARDQISPRLADLIEEMTAHKRTHHAYIHAASEPVKLVTTASLTHLFNAHTYLLSTKLDEFDAAIDTETVTEIDPNPPAPPEHAGPFIKMVDALVGTTSAPSVIDDFMDAVLNYDACLTDYRKEMIDCPIVPLHMKERLKVHTRNDIFAPDLKETRITDRPLTRATYEQIQRDPRVRQDKFMNALAVAEYLSTAGVPVDDAEVAAGILITALPLAMSEDLTLQSTVIGQDVVRLIRAQIEEIQNGTPIAERTMMRTMMSAFIIAATDARRGLDRTHTLVETDVDADDEKKRRIIKPTLKQADKIIRDITEGMNSFGLALEKIDAAGALYDQVHISLNLLTEVYKKLQDLAPPAPASAPKKPAGSQPARRQNWTDGWDNI